MNPETLEALKGSIEKWEKIVAGTGTDEGTSNCPLCQLFYWNHCRGCPVAEKSGSAGCEDTPYMNYFGGNEEDTYGMTENAKEELEYLRSLLPNE